MYIHICACIWKLLPKGIRTTLFKVDCVIDKYNARMMIWFDSLHNEPYESKFGYNITEVLIKLDSKERN